LAALGHAGDQQRLEVGAGSVNGGGVASRAGAENQNLGVLVGRHLRRAIKETIKERL
jgi:hypothetical protein